ncbi:hypothetical protein E4U42_003988 [Claviceps africana]|uniref:Cysteine protease n=1 Tax=Claviceps africana TaxID=83212 RepID=A0A8K0J605_9HYPO|nr:hypothetical protein E4U42_003988 [Claviceps africana]
MDSAIANVDLGRYRRIVQMFWDPEPVNDMNLDQPVWCLGCVYSLSAKENTTERPEAQEKSLVAEKKSTREDRILDMSGDKADTTAMMNTNNANLQEPSLSPGGMSSFLTSNDERVSGAGWPLAFLQDFDARFWMTYRSNFPVIAKSASPGATAALSLSMRVRSQLVDEEGFTSDSGWGCMIRSGQSLLCNAMAVLNLGRGWRRGALPDKERHLISLFADDLRAPYSIQNFVKNGEKLCGKFPGEWFGPSATACCIQALVNSREPQLRVYFTGEGPDVYQDSFMKIAKPEGEDFHPTLILVGTRLGIDKVTPVYWEALIASLQMTQSVGIAGGRPSSSHYFVGSQGHFLFYLDPHHTRKALPYHKDVIRYTKEDIDTCHTSRIRKIHVREMDPSMLVGFLIQNEEDWFEWKRCVKHVQGKSIINVADRHPANDQQSISGRSIFDEVEPLSDNEEAGTIRPAQGNEASGNVIA